MLLINWGEMWTLSVGNSYIFHPKWNLKGIDMHNKIWNIFTNNKTHCDNCLCCILSTIFMREIWKGILQLYYIKKWIIGNLYIISLHRNSGKLHVLYWPLHTSIYYRQFALGTNIIYRNNGIMPIQSTRRKYEDAIVLTKVV